jgi:HdeA/HdeB family
MRAWAELIHAMKIPAAMKILAALGLILGLLPCVSSAAPLNLTTLTCAKYENEVLPAAAANPAADPINTVMWLFGYAVAKSGAHVMYADALTPFGYALDDECKSNLNETLAVALTIVKPDSKNPMDLSTLECSTFAPRHANLILADPESANTITMWLFGFSVAKSGSSLFDADAVTPFQKALLAYCAKHPNVSLFDTLTALGKPKLIKAPVRSKP